MSSNDHIEEILNELLRRTGLIETGIKNLGSRLEAVENDVSELKSTVETQIQHVVGELSTQIQTVHDELTTFRKEQQQSNKDISLALHKLERRVDAASIEINKLQAEIRVVNDRLDSFEKEPA